MRRFLLCTDMDRTLIPNGAAPESAGARPLFARLAARPEVTLAYVTGRHRALIEEAIREYRLPQPDFAIADVGSTIYELGHGAWWQWDEWDQEIDQDWQGKGAGDIHRLLPEMPELTLQEPEKQNRHKLSFYLPLAADARRIREEIGRRLKAAGVRANLIWSVDEQLGIGLLDILPARANKRHAIEFLMRRHGFDHADTVFAGDSGNDLDVLLSPIHAVLVANAGDDVRAAARSAPQASLFLARGGYLGMNGNYSAGILEGLAHYLPDVDAWLQGGA
ncbi:MAG TPA: HAD-IIB family hydrolase [Mariprofundaceae bacterium]|nr:HAD-IIB family hydrolase [Mariprofundaceae bacterium]